MEHNNKRLSEMHIRESRTGGSELGGGVELRTSEPGGEIPGHGDSSAQKSGETDSDGCCSCFVQVRREGEGQSRDALRSQRCREHPRNNRARRSIYSQVLQHTDEFGF
jgi:hypothetical protein